MSSSPGRVDEGTHLPTTDGFKFQVKESRTLLIKAHRELQLKNEQIQLLADENAQLLSQYKGEKEARRRIQVDIQHKFSQKTDECSEGMAGVARAHPQQTDSLMGLTKEVKRARDELQDVYFENSRYRAEVQKLTSSLEKMDESNCAEREEWKSKAVQLLQKLQIEEDNAVKSRAEAEKLATDCIKLGSENLKLDQALSKQEDKIRLILKELDDTVAQVKTLTEANETLRKQAQADGEYVSATKAEYQKSQEQLRLMSEKVFHLIGQLEQMDKWKVQAQEDLHAAARKIATLEGRAENLQKVLDRDDRVRKQMETKIKNEKEKATSFRLTGQEFRRKFIAEERIKAKMIELLRTKEKTMSEIMNKYKDAQWALQAQRGTRSVRQKRVEDLETQVKEMITAISGFRAKIETLENNQKKLVEAVRVKEEDLRNSRRRERQCLHKLQEIINKDGTKVMAPALGPEAIDELLNGKQHNLGQHVRYMLGKLHISESIFVDLSVSPTQLIEKLAKRFHRLKLKRVSAKSTISDAAESTAFFQRMCQLLPPTFHSGSRPDTFPQMHNHIRCLNMSNLGLTDDHITILSDFLYKSPHLLCLDLSHNQIHDSVFLALVKQVCSCDSNVQMLLFGDNFISQAAIKSIFLWIRGHRDVPAVYFRLNRTIGRGHSQFVPHIAARIGKHELLIDVTDNEFTDSGFDQFVLTLMKGASMTVDGAMRAEIDRKIDTIMTFYRPEDPNTTAVSPKAAIKKGRVAWDDDQGQLSPTGDHTDDDEDDMEDEDGSDRSLANARSSSTPTLSKLVKSDKSPYVSTTKLRGSREMSYSSSNFMRNAQELLTRKRTRRLPPPTMDHLMPNIKPRDGVVSTTATRRSKKKKTGTRRKVVGKGGKKHSRSSTPLP